MLMCIFHDNNANQNIKKLQTFLQKVSFFFCTQCHTCSTGTVGPRTMLPLGYQICSVVQISVVQGSMFQHCASYFTSINPMFQHYATYFISGNPRFQRCASFFISANPRFSIVQELSGTFGHQCYTEVSVV